MTAEKVEKYLRSALNSEDILVMDSRNPEEMFVIFNSDKAWCNYVDGYDSEQFSIWELKDEKLYGFSFETYDPGVYMRSDGTGEPPSYDMQEHPETFKTLKELLAALAKFIFQTRINEAEIDYDYNS